jgi:hypothetical protein
VLDANAAATTVFGYAPELLGETPGLWHHPDHGDALRAAITAALAARIVGRRLHQILHGPTGDAYGRARLQAVAAMNGRRRT